jgi:hypothetical protein
MFYLLENKLYFNKNNVVLNAGNVQRVKWCMHSLFSYLVEPGKVLSWTVCEFSLLHILLF